MFHHQSVWRGTPWLAWLSGKMRYFLVMRMANVIGRPPSDFNASQILQYLCCSLSVCAIRSQASCLLSRLVHTGENACDAAKSREERVREDMRSHFESSARGRHLSRVGHLIFWWGNKINFSLYCLFVQFSSNIWSRITIITSWEQVCDQGQEGGLLRDTTRPGGSYKGQATQLKRVRGLVLSESIQASSNQDLVEETVKTSQIKIVAQKNIYNMVVCIY